jgi:uncharacterized protein
VPPAPLEIGTARARPGSVVYGEFEGVPLPTGGRDNFPVIIAQGNEPGPVVWLTAGIHGAEYTGIAVIHRLLSRDLLAALHGSIVALPTLNPAGLRTASRTPYYLTNQDPNRLFPYPNQRTPSPIEPPPSPLELAYKRLYEAINRTANLLIDLHNFAPGSIPFALRDPIFYRDSRERTAALTLQDQVGGLLQAFGFTIINEFVFNDYLKKGLHRSVSGAALNNARIPAFTVELGGYGTIDPVIVAACAAGLRNVLRKMGMLHSPPEAITGIRVVSPGYPVRRLMHPYAPEAGIVEYLAHAGDMVQGGTPIARITDIYGRGVGKNDGRVVSEYDGLVLGQSVGAVCYQHDLLMTLAVRDNREMVLPLPP